MSDLTPLFVDESTFRSCLPEQIDCIVDVQGYNCFVNEEVLESIEQLECASWVSRQLVAQRLSKHRITNTGDIGLLLRVAKRCGACRAEICSYVAAQREGGIVITQDPVARKLLFPHFPQVKALAPKEFLRAHQVKDLFDDERVLNATDKASKSFSSARP